MMYLVLIPSFNLNSCLTYAKHMLDIFFLYSIYSSFVSGPVYYQDKRAPSQAHRDFEPFDLEKWRENRMFERNMRRS